jgi:D-alanyl-D-alanine carboxypeptidase
MNLKQELKVLFLLSALIYSLLFIWDEEKTQQDILYVNNYRLERDTKKLQKIVDMSTAEGVIVYDTLNNKILAGKGVDKDYSLASLTKIVTSVIVYEKDKNLLDEIREMMKTSDNDEAERLALVFGKTELQQTQYMENFTKKFGAFNFRNVSGLDIVVSTTTDERLPGGETDIVSLLLFIKEYYFKYPEIFDQTIIPDSNTNIIVNQLSFLTGGKTGFTSLSGGNLFVSVQKGLNRQIFIIVLNSTEKNRFVDVQNIANFLLQSSI